MQHLRECYKRNVEDIRREAAKHSINDLKILNAVTLPRSVNTKENRGNDEEVARDVEVYYANDGP
jgi:hypothetical protein